MLQKNLKKYAVVSYILVGEEFLHPANLALVFGHGLVILSIFDEMFFAVVNLSAVLQLKGAQSLKRFEKNLRETSHQYQSHHTSAHRHWFCTLTS